MLSADEIASQTVYQTSCEGRPAANLNACDYETAGAVTMTSPQLHTIDVGYANAFVHRDSYADRGVVQQVFANRDYDTDRFARGPEISRFYENCDSPLIVDCGANIGAASVWFAGTYPRAQVLALEPESSNFALLQQNTPGLNALPIHGAIAAESGTLQLRDPGEGEWGYSTIGDGFPIGQVRAYSMKELLELAPGRTPFILKIDIEGAETELFRESPELYARFPVIIVELHDWLLPRRGTSHSFLKWHAGQDRDFVQFGENTFSFCNKLLLPI